MNVGGVLIYRCRLCGALDESLSVPDVAAAVASISSTGSVPRHWDNGGRATRLHDCGGGRHGIAELIGGRGDPE